MNIQKKWLIGTMAAGLFSLIAGDANAALSKWAPAFELKDMDGNTHKFADYKGQPMLFNFFGTWCGPCNAEAPKLKALSIEYGAKGVQFFQFASAESISSRPARDYQTWLNYLTSWRTRHGIPFPILVDAVFGPTSNLQRQGDTFDAYISAAGIPANQAGYPTNVVVDASGAIVYAQSGFSESAVRRALDEVTNIPPGKPAGVTLARQAGNFVRVSWTAPVGQIANYEVEIGNDPSFSLSYGIHQVAGDQTQTDIQLDRTNEVLYFRVTAINASGKMGQASTPAKFQMKPFCEMKVNDLEVRAGDRLKIDTLISNGGLKDENVQVYYLLELAGTVYFFNPALNFVTYPISTPLTIPQNLNASATLLDLTFDPSNSLPDVAGTWYMGLVSDSTYQLEDIEVVPFSFKP